MKFSFGIVTGGSRNHREQKNSEDIADRICGIIDSIQIQGIPDVDVIVIGGENFYGGKNFVRHFSFDEDVLPGWISKKKNVITALAKHENVVYMHDYFSLDERWYENMISFEKPFHVMMNRIVDINGDRYHDWVINPWTHPWFSNHTMETFLPYDVEHMSKYQYISGGYWIAKKHVMHEFPVNEILLWGQGEDVEWSQRVSEKYEFVMNEKSIVRLTKPRFANDWKLVGEEGMKIVDSLKK